MITVYLPLQSSLAKNSPSLSVAFFSKTTLPFSFKVTLAPSIAFLLSLSLTMNFKIASQQSSFDFKDLS